MRVSYGSKISSSAARHQAGPFPRPVSCTCRSSALLTNSTESIAASNWERNCSIHRPRQVSPPVNRLTHRLFDGSQHSLYNLAVGSRHGAVASSSNGLSYSKTQHCRVDKIECPIGSARASSASDFDAALPVRYPRHLL